jgi:hypothetical protein
MSFSEGFTSGFNMVDSALQKRNALALEQEKQARDDVRYKDELVHRSGQEAQALKWHDDAAGLAATAVTYAKTRDTAKDAFDKTAQDDTRTNHADTIGLQRESNSISRINANNQAAHLKLSYEREQGMLAAQQSETRIKELEYAKKQAMPILESMQSTDPKTGQMTMAWSDNPSLFKQQLSASQTATGFDYKKMYENPDLFTKDIQTIKNGLADINHWDKNKTGVLASLNTTMKSDIEAGKIDQTYDGLDQDLKGGIVTSVEINDIFPAPGGNALVAGVQTKYKMPDGSFKFSAAPMSELRSANPNTDPNVKVIQINQITNKIDAIDQISTSIRNDPAHTKLIQSYIKGAHKEKSDSKVMEIPILDKQGNPTGENRDIQMNSSGLVLDPVAQMTKSNTNNQVSVGDAPVNTKEGAKAWINGESYINRGGKMYPTDKVD